MQKKAFVAVVTRAKVKDLEAKQEPTQGQNQVPIEPQRPPIAIHKLVEVRRFRVLAQLVRTVAWMWRAAKKFISPSKAVNKPKWEAVCSAGAGGVISVRE